MKIYKPNTVPYTDFLKSLLKLGFVEYLKAINDLKDVPIQIINQGDDPPIENHPLNFVEYDSGVNKKVYFRI